VFGIIFFITGTNIRIVNASPVGQTECPGDYLWRQINSGQFVVLYTASHFSLAEQISNQYLKPIDDELDNYSTAFSTTIPTPITIRIYPSQTDYYCLNALSPLISSEDSHSHIGNREIALIANVINRSPMTWDAQAMNAIRHEIAVLYAEKLTDGNAPPGLLKGLGGYFEDPDETFLERWEEAGNINIPDRGWQRLWEEDSPASNSLVLLQQASSIGYLIDVFGWDKFISFLGNTAEFQGYRQALVETYGVNLLDLQSHWMLYFPVYVQTRWQANVIHNYDLTQFRQLNTEGAYEDSAEKLSKGIVMIELFGTDEQLEEAQILLDQAKLGAEAGKLALEARQAILAMDYRLGYSKAVEALNIYQGLGDTRRIPEVETYRDVCAEVLTLREELDQLRGVGTPLDPARTQRIITIGHRLNQLGDAQGANDVQIALLLLGSGQQVFVQGVTIVGLLVSVYLIYRKIIHIRTQINPRIDLL